MASKYTCYVPNEWAGLSEKALRETVKQKASKQWRYYKRLEGTTVRLEDVTAKLVYHNYNPWMRKSEDQSNSPNMNEYFGIRMNCILCSKSCSSSYYPPFYSR
uniref:BV6 family protein n=1 Tax=Microplitis mediator bracovirus TaxID=1836595 RepID=A0A1D5APJ2_9VIRU|nr:hypothetical protein A6F54_66 [Microplitis mediator bracovirus]AOH69143.1 hypothetical protein A6F54_70 [Microplitis mediator bracovirus]